MDAVLLVVYIFTQIPFISFVFVVGYLVANDSLEKIKSDVKSATAEHKRLWMVTGVAFVMLWLLLQYMAYEALIFYGRYMASLPK